MLADAASVDTVLATLSSEDGDSRIEFQDGQLAADGYFTCRAVVVADGAEWPPIELEMIEPYRRDTLGYFEELAAGATTGWEGENTWTSEHRQLSLAATHTGDGAISVRVLARWRPDYETERRGELTMSVEAVKLLAPRMSDFLRLKAAGACADLSLEVRRQCRPRRDRRPDRLRRGKVCLREQLEVECLACERLGCLFVEDVRDVSRGRRRRLPNRADRYGLCPKSSAMGA
jgi:Family of unknown function (DUF6228)